MSERTTKGRILAIKKQPIATFTMVVHYYEDMSLPDFDHLEDIVDKGREQGAVEVALYKTLNPVEKSLV